MQFLMFYLLNVSYLLQAQILYETSSCTTHYSRPGVCTKLRECPEAYQALKRDKFHDFLRCSMLNFTEIVCCPSTATTRILNITTRVSKRACDAFYPDNNEPLIPLITGGIDARPGQFPFMAALGLYLKDKQFYSFECGGALISKNFILTAAHCILNLHEENITIARLGVIDIPFNITQIDGKIDYQVKNTFLHFNYSSRGLLNDIGLVELKKSIDIQSNVKPACLLTNQEIFPTNFIIVGWGLNDNNEGRKNRLQRALVHFYPQQNCSSRYKKYNREINSLQLCAMSDESDVCVGDSGGPLISQEDVRPHIVGITSYGESGCFPGRPSIYTNVYHYLDFIESIVWPSGTL